MPVLLQAKLKPPRPVNDLIHRQQLIQRLTPAAVSPLTLVSAPAGFGKTTLLVEWSAQVGLPTAWLSLDENDNDLTIFSSYLVAAVRSAFPKACVGTLALLEGPRIPVPALLARQFGNDLVELPNDFILVLDDYHLLTEPDILAFADAFLQHVPPPVHLILATRVDPPLPLALLRARGQLVEIRAAELLFSRSEAEQFLTQASATTLSADVVEYVQARTEGWAAGLRLAALSLRGLDEPARPDTFRGQAGHFVIDYLVNEVLARESDAVRSFLLQTSLLDKFTPDLCDALIGQEPRTSRAIIEHLRQANLFLVTLDEAEEWYRYHHLFRDVLAQKRGAAFDERAAAALHARASAWFQQEGFYTDAIQHALAAGMELTAAQVIEANMQHALNQENNRLLERWLAFLPSDLVSRRPGLLIAHVAALDLRLDAASTETLLTQAQTLMAQANGSADAATHDAMQGNLESLRCKMLYWQGQFAASLAAANRARALLPPDHIYARGVAVMYTGLDYLCLGQSDRAISTLTAEIEREPAPPVELALRALVALSSIYFVLGDTVRLEQTAQSLYQRATRHHFAGSVAWAHRFLGLAHYERNDLAMATQHFSLAAQARASINNRAGHEAMVGLTYAYRAAGRLREAEQTAAALVEYDSDIRDSQALAETYSLQARLMLDAGQVQAARSQLAPGHALPTTPRLWLETPALTEILILLEQGTKKDIAAALSQAIALRERAQQLCDTRLTVQALALQARALHASGKSSAAQDTLEQALQLAERGGLVRVFVDLDVPLAEILSPAQAHSPQYKRVLDAFSARSPGALSAVAQPSVSSVQVPFDPLTAREIQVLELLARRLSNKEIAATLVISKATAKTHIQHIYAKLGVNDRRAAVTTARALGILPTQ